MEPIFQQNFSVSDLVTDRYGKLKLSAILYFAQEAAGQHCHLLGTDHDTLSKQRLFWAVTRHRVQITRLPVRGETITVETWPMPTTRVAYPRAMAAYDAQGNELFRAISLWVLMDMDSRGMILPGKSGIDVEGTLRGSELSVPHSLIPKASCHTQSRTVTYSCLDRNGHMNNTRYMDWIDDLLGSDFHDAHLPKEFILCYLNEAREGQEIHMDWELLDAGCLQVDGHRHHAENKEKQERVFSAQVFY